MKIFTLRKLHFFLDKGEKFCYGSVLEWGLSHRRQSNSRKPEWRSESEEVHNGFHNTYLTPLRVKSALSLDGLGLSSVLKCLSKTRGHDRGLVVSERLFDPSAQCLTL